MSASDNDVGEPRLRRAQRGIGWGPSSVFSADQAQRDSVLRFATAWAAWSVTCHGGFAGMPTIAHVEALLNDGAAFLPSAQACWRVCYRTAPSW